MLAIRITLSNENTFLKKLEWIHQCVYTFDVVVGSRDGSAIPFHGSYGLLGSMLHFNIDLTLERINTFVHQIHTVMVVTGIHFVELRIAK